MLHTDAPLPCSFDPELWFSRQKADIVAAKKACGRCPYQLRCLEDVKQTEELLGHQLHGVHGGLTPPERRRLTIRKIA